MSEENLRFDNESKLVIFFVLHDYFLKEIESMFTVFLSNYRGAHRNFGELKKAVGTLDCQLRFSWHFSFYLTTTCVSITQKKQVTCFLSLSQ